MCQSSAVRRRDLRLSEGKVKRNDEIDARLFWQNAVIESFRDTDRSRTSKWFKSTWPAQADLHAALLVFTYLLTQ